MKKVLILMISVVIMIGLTACGKPEPQVETVEEKIIPEYSVNIVFDCTENILFNRYDINVYMDDEKLGIIDHGTEKEFSVILKEGSHTLKLTESDDSSVNGYVDFVVNGDMSLKYEIYCTNDQVEIELIPELTPPFNSENYENEKYKKILKSFEDAGFVEIKGNPLKDLTVDNLDQKYIVEKISIDGITEFSVDDTFYPESEVEISYHSPKEINPPGTYYNLEDENYEGIVERFKKAGFINIEVKSVAVDADSYEDDNNVKEISIGDDDTFYSDDLFPFDSTVIITYYEAPVALTIENSPELKDVLSVKDPYDPIVEKFAIGHYGDIIEFDGNIAYMSKHGDYSTRYDLLIYADDYSETSSIGPSFQFIDVNYYDLNLTGDNVPDYVERGDNLHIIAEVGKYNESSGNVELIPISIEVR